MHRTAFIMAAALWIVVPVFAAAEQLEILNCRSGTVNMLHAEKELTVFGLELKGITFTRNANKALDNSSSSCVGTVRITSSDSASNGFCKYLDGDGDTAMIEWQGQPPKGGSWSFVGGTGKWNGVQGKGNWETMPNPRPIAPGTFQTCNVAR